MPRYIDCPPYVSHLFFPPSSPSVIFSEEMECFLHASCLLFVDDREMCVRRSRPLAGDKRRPLPDLPVQSRMDQRQEVRVSELIGRLQSGG